MKIEGTRVSKNLGDTVRLQSEKREEWIREIRRERLQEIAESASSAPRLTSSSASVPQRKQLASTPEPHLPRGEGTEPSVQSTRS